MSEREERGGDGLLIGILVVLVVLLFGGVGLALFGFSFVRAERQRAMAQAEMARMAELQARTVADEAALELQRVKEQPADIVLVVEVGQWEPATDKVPVHAALKSVADEWWIVPCTVLERQAGEYSLDSCNVLVASPLGDLGVEMPGEKLRLALKVADGPPPRFSTGVNSEPPKITLADPQRPLELLSVQKVK